LGVTHTFFQRTGGKNLVVSLLLLLGAASSWQTRRYFIRSWFDQRAPVRLPTQGPPHSPVADALRGPLQPVRVMLIDGLAEAVAQQLPGLNRLCQQGLRLRVDVGFPSVSLPVQHVLWTGTWQHQSGIQFHISRLARPIFESLPETVARRRALTVAIAESHREIVSSFPFARIIAPAEGERRLDATTLRRGMVEAALSEAALVFVHLLSVDEMGHQYGPAHPAYRQAARAADGLIETLGRMRRPEWSVLLLSDHGHLWPQGGHGDGEKEVRWVRACLVGPGIAPGARAEATMVDMNRVLAERLNVAVPRWSQGRTLAEVLRSSGAVQAPPFPWEFSSISLLFWGTAGACAVAFFWHFGRARARGAVGDSRWMVLALPWGLALSVLLLILGHGFPSLSQSYVYRLLAPQLGWISLPAALIPGWQLGLFYRRRPLPPAQALGMMISATLIPALLLMGWCGWPLRRPPLFPWLTGWTSVLLHFTTIGCLALALWSLVWAPGSSVSKTAATRGEG
jgi:hypothetical protein